MTGKNKVNDQKFRRCLVIGACALILLSLVAALWINGMRAQAEARDKTVGLLVDYDELKRLADGSQDVTFADMVRKAAKAGATGLVVRERILADWESAGDIVVLQGSQLELYQALQSELPSQTGAEGGQPATPLFSSSADVEPDAGKTYIIVRNPQVYDQLFSLLEAKRRYPEPFAFLGYQGIVTQLHSSERATLGLGFPMEGLQIAAEAGFEVIPRLRGWEPVRQDNLATVFEWVGQIPGLAGIGFNDASVPGGGTNPLLQDYLAAAIEPLGKPLISFEFYDQAGFAGLAGRLDNQVLRAHAIAENELKKYANVRDAMDRFNLAATERNIRYIFLRFYGLENPAASLTSNTDLITAVREGLMAEGFQIGKPQTISSFQVPYGLRFLLGLGVVAGGGWLLALAAAPFASKKLYLPYVLLLGAACLIWAVLLLKAPVLSRKLFALAAAILFPSLGTLLVLKQDMAGGRALSLQKPSLPRAIGSLLILSAFTLAGAMIMSAFLAEPAFMLKLDSFVGVKVSHLIPLLLVPAVLWLWEKNWLGRLTNTAKSNVQFWQLAVGLVILAGLAVYILRTGNDSLSASGIEMKFRQLLDRLLGVRPRTKEFLIGHPLMLVLLYFGYRFSMYPVLLLGLIGQISLINTYAHIHTPLVVSLLRSLHGLWIGILIGAAAIGVILLAFRLLSKIIDGQKKGGEPHVS
ncbi:MAG: DUF5693 family protein [Clostridiales bacterium]